jgi:broad specificity phosphatase PhoE
MAMPNNVIFVRHGESEGNHAIRMKRDRGIDLFTPEFRKRHGSRWRLTDKGI